MKKIILCILVLGLSACSSDKNSGGDQIPGADQPPLNEQQKERMNAFAQELTDIEGATSEHTGSKQPQSATNAVARLMSAAKKEESKTLQPSAKSEELSQQIGAALQSGQCEILSKGMESQPQPFPSQPNGPFAAPMPNEMFNIEMSTEIVNTKSTECPIYSKFSMLMQGKVDAQSENAMSMDMSFSMGQEFQAKEWAPLYLDLEIVSYENDFTGAFSMKASQAGMIMNANGSGTTSIMSKPGFEGEVLVSTNMNMNASGTNENNMKATMQVVSDYTFADFRAVGVMRGSAEGDMENMKMVYYINGEEVTEAEYGQLFSSQFTEKAMDTISEGDPRSLN